MQELVVISGKGGTGKTSLTAAFIALSKKTIICDADVDAADLHLLMAPAIQHRYDFTGGGLAEINREKCTGCGLCRTLCRFGAIDENYGVDPIDCEGCGVCVDLCPEQAIDFPVQTCGEWFISDTRFGPMVHAKLGIAEENSGKLVSLIRRKTKELAGEKGLDLIMTDGPPGIGCPVIAAIGGASVLLIVTEPSVSGRHDMARVADLATHFNVPAAVCINKFDLNLDQSTAIETMAAERQMPVVGRIPFDPVFTASMVRGQTVFEYDGNSEAASAVRHMWKILKTLPAMKYEVGG
ncbi:MAG: 4Fe-4S binding protein [Desulfobacteraceae bacterium]|nr:4Fe-4S binding protein [Desulfobacteraceae bacterium]